VKGGWGWLSAGAIGLVLLVFAGLPIALYSIYKDLNEQNQRVRPAAMKAAKNAWITGMSLLRFSALLLFQ
jgi:Na+/proline symporter